MKRIEEARNDFCFLEENIYLDSASIGLAFNSQGEIARSYYQQMKYQGMAGDPLLDDKRDRVKERIANLLHCRTNEVYFMSTLTEGVNYLAHSLYFEAGDEIVVLEDDYPSLVLAFDFLENKGVKVKKIPVVDERREECLIEAISSNTKLVLLSQVQYTTGYTFDLQRIGKVCHAKGAMVLVDGTQGLLSSPTDLEDIDIYIASTYKWFLGDFGLAFCIIKNPILDQIIPLYNGERGKVIQYATINHPMIWMVDGILDYLEEYGVANIIQRDLGLASYLYQQLLTIGINPIVPLANTHTIVSFTHPQAKIIVQELAKRRIHINNKGNIIRISPHFYNNQEDLDTFVQALLEVL